MKLHRYAWVEDAETVLFTGTLPQCRAFYRSCRSEGKRLVYVYYLHQRPKRATTLPCRRMLPKIFLFLSTQN